MDKWGCQMMPPSNRKQAFAKLKALLRKATARTRDEFWQVIAELLDRFLPQECQNYIRNSG